MPGSVTFAAIRYIYNLEFDMLFCIGNDIVALLQMYFLRNSFCNLKQYPAFLRSNSTGTKSFIEVVHKQPSKVPREAAICIPIGPSIAPVDVGDAVTPLQRAILAAIGHAASEDVSRKSFTDSASDNLKNTTAIAPTKSKPEFTHNTAATLLTQPLKPPTSASKILSPEHLETELNKKLKRQGFARAEEVLAFFEALKNRGHCSGRQAKFLISSFGSRMSLDRAGKKMNALEEIWKTLPFLGVVYAAEHYNAALRVLIENEESFSPIQVLLEMESQGRKSASAASSSATPPRCASASGFRGKSDGDRGELRVEPDRNTFELFIALFCQEGRVEAVGPILNHMQSKNLLVGENILNSLIYGHVKVGDEATTRRILSLMAQSGIPSTVSTVEAILCGYAESGDILKMSMLIREVRKKGSSKNVDLKEIIGGGESSEESRRSGSDSKDDKSDDGVIIAASPTALTPPNVMPYFDFEVQSMPLIDNQALLSSILALVKCGHGEHLKVIANQIVVDSETPLVFLHQFRNALFHLLIEGYKRESFALLGHFVVKTFRLKGSVSENGKKVFLKSEHVADLAPADPANDGPADHAAADHAAAENAQSDKISEVQAKSEFFHVRDDIIRTFFKAVMDQKLTLEEFLQLFSTHLFELNANVATLVLQKNIDLISKCYSESELVFLS